MFADYVLNRLNDDSNRNNNSTDWFEQFRPAAPVSFKSDKYLKAEIATLSRNNYKPQATSYKLLIAKPQTFMNRSGNSVREIMKKYREISFDHVIVVHDDLDIALGKFKISSGVGPKTHNGIDSIEKAIGTNKFSRIRIGVENRNDRRIPGEAYVLQDFEEDEKLIIKSTFSDILKRLQEIRPVDNARNNKF